MMKTFSTILILLLAATGLAYADGAVDPLVGATVPGWAVDTTFPSIADYVTMYVDGPKGTGTRLSFGGNPFMKADQPSPDIKYGGNHRFKYDLPASLNDNKPHQIFVYRHDTELLAPQPIYNSSPQATTVQATFTQLYDFDKNTVVLSVSYKASDWNSVKVLFNDVVKFTAGADFSPIFTWPTGCNCGMALAPDKTAKTLGVNIHTDVSKYAGYEIRINNASVFKAP